jgi:drug/metabolite transporter (DMT)-like permease
MLAAGIKTPVPLEELECHLREDVEQQIKLGSNAQQAYAAAVGQIGQARALKNEFKKSERTVMKKTLLFLVGILGVLFGTAFILPALAWYRDHGAMPADHLGFLLLGIAIAIGGLSTTIYGFKRLKA